MPLESLEKHLTVRITPALSLKAVTHRATYYYVEYIKC
jgi:hypothetical protein